MKKSQTRELIRLKFAPTLLEPDLETLFLKKHQHIADIIVTSAVDLDKPILTASELIFNTTYEIELVTLNIHLNKIVVILDYLSQWNGWVDTWLSLLRFVPGAWMDRDGGAPTVICILMEGKLFLASTNGEIMGVNASNIVPAEIGIQEIEALAGGLVGIDCARWEDGLEVERGKADMSTEIKDMGRFVFELDIVAVTPPDLTLEGVELN